MNVPNLRHGKVEALRAKYGLTAEAALEKAAAFIKRVSKAEGATVSEKLRA